MSERQVRFGLVGFGAWGQCHAGAIDRCASAELAAVCARSEASQAAARETFPSATVYGDVHEMLAGEPLDAVDVVVPSHLHFKIASAVLDHGVHLLLEKPMALSLADCRGLVERAQEKQCLLAIGHELRLSSLWGRVKELIHEGVVGEPQYVLVELSRNPYRQGSGSWRYDAARVGSWILEEPIHFFDLARWYLAAAGNPTTIYAAANARDADRPELQDNFSAIMHFASGAYAVVTQTLSAFEHHQTVKVTGTRGALWASWSGAVDRTRHPTFSLRVFDGEQVIEEPIERTAGELFELEDQIQRFCDAILDAAPLAATGSDGLWSVAMCLAAQRSVALGKPVGIGDTVE